MNEKVPDYIIEGIKKCKELGMDPNDLPVPKKIMGSNELREKRLAYQEVLSVVDFFSNKLLDSLADSPILIVVSDEKGYLLDIKGNELMQANMKQLGIQIGSFFSLEDTGLNVISSTLEQDGPVRIIGKEHYHTTLHEIACYANTFHYTDEDHLLGTIGIMTPVQLHNPLYLAMITQVVDSIERELLLRKQNRKLNLLNQVMLDRMGNGVIITDAKGMVTECNEYANEVLEELSLIGTNIYQISSLETYFRRVLENQHIVENIEITCTSQTGLDYVFLLDVIPVFEGHKQVGAFGKFLNITDRYLMEKKVKEAEKQAFAGRIAAGIAHEVRNPLTTVRGYLQLLESDLTIGNASLFNKLLIPEIDRANKIITDFLTIAKPKPFSKGFEKIRVEDYFMQYLYKFLESEAHLYGVDFQLDIGPETKELLFECDREELLQVFINLFQNSLHAKKENDLLNIIIRTRLMDNGYVQFTFSDNGKGIEPGILAHIFDPFFSTKDIGTGLGLSISKKIMYNHKGYIKAISNENGTTFFIEVPVSGQND